MPLKITTKPLLLETLKIENGVITNLPYHQARCDRSRHAIYGTTQTLELQTQIIPPPTGVYRCRVLYAQRIHSIEYIPYIPPKFSSLKIITSDIDYPYKYANRDALNTLLSAHETYDDIIITKEGYLTDTSIANIAFYDGKRWLTPQKPLLQGTMRQKLIDEGFLQPKQIKEEEIPNYSHVALMNAMLGFKILNDITIYDNKGKCYDY